MEVASAPAVRPARGKRRASAAFVPRAALFGVLPLLAVAALGAPYYLLSWQERLRSDLHEVLKPSGLVGQSAGLLAFALFLFLWLYPLRKRLSSMAFLGTVPRWLDAHIVAGVLMPLAGAVHAGFRFTGIIGLGYFAMLVVAGSGVIGRYLYLRIPRARSGAELSREEVAARRRGLVGEIVEASGVPAERVRVLLRPPDPGTGRRSVLGTLWGWLLADRERRRVVRALTRELDSVSPAQLRTIVRLARQEIALSQQVRLLDATARVFRLWHAFHLPFAVTAFLAVTIHVVVAIAFGATWLG